MCLIINTFNEAIVPRSVRHLTWMQLYALKFNKWGQKMTLYGFLSCVYDMYDMV